MPAAATPIRTAIALRRETLRDDSRPRNVRSRPLGARLPTRFKWTDADIGQRDTRDRVSTKPEVGMTCDTRDTVRPCHLTVITHPVLAATHPWIPSPCGLQRVADPRPTPGPAVLCGHDRQTHAGRRDTKLSSGEGR